LAHERLAKRSSDGRGSSGGAEARADDEVRYESFDTMDGGGGGAGGSTGEHDALWTTPSLSAKGSRRGAHDESADGDAADADSAGRGASPLAGNQRPLPFEEGKFTLLESELKALYCAITRARINVWICDFDKTKRDPVFRYTSLWLETCVKGSSCIMFVFIHVQLVLHRDHTGGSLKRAWQMP